ncbi:cell division protein FtsQ/DivIB [Seongchinamella sediminis]|uniref:cell division protein FtsQ/DivIB n=1 Tax=Seongchinamella sediminis TaxID=2283635 RepID=UPI0013C3473D|nr:cell division protein FtsQ/DivIB [Seongchinamella sediminis]
MAIKLPQLRLRHSERPAPAKRKRKPAAPGHEAPAASRRQRHGAAKGATRKVAAAAAEKQPRNFRWLNRILILLGVGVVSIAALQAYITLQSIPVERITVTGELEHTRTAAVQDMVYPALAGGFLGADLGRVQQQLEGLPWIRQASVRRVWPNALEIHVVEQLPIARWGEQGFLNHEGEVFRPSQRKAWQTLPVLSGPEGQAPALMRNYQRLVDLLKPMGLSLSALAVDDRAQMTATLSGGQLLKIGGVDFLERMNRFKTVYRAELAAQMENIESIDLRYERGLAVALRPTAADTDATGENDKA